MHDVIIAGAGPVGVWLACELRLAGLRPVVLERLREPTGISKSGALSCRSMDVLDHRGLLDRFLPDVPTPPFSNFAAFPVDLSSLPTAHPFSLMIRQDRVEALLHEWAVEQDVDIRWGHALTDIRQDDDGVTVIVEAPEGPTELQARFAVGCDGGRSTVRRLAGFGFPGTDPTVNNYLGDVAVELTDEVAAVAPGLAEMGWGTIRTDTGFLALTHLPEPGLMRVSTLEWGQPPFDPSTTMTLEELQASARRILGAELRMTNPRWLSRNTNMTRQADTYRRGRVLLAGDAAHIHFQGGGPGMNTGLQDASNLAWKLAATVAGWAPPGLLDTYHDERHPIGERVLLSTRAHLELLGPSPGITALRQLVGEMLELDEVRHFLGALTTQVYVRYDVAAGDTADPVVTGAWAPDLVVDVDGTPRRIAELAASAPLRGVFVDLTPSHAYRVAAEPWHHRVELIEGTGEPGGPDAVLVRPDGYVAWAPAADVAPAAATAGLRAALERWFGSAFAEPVA